MNNTTTAAELIAKLSALPPDAVIILTSSECSGAWSALSIEPRTIALNYSARDRYSGNNPHNVIHDFESVPEYLENYPNDTIVQGYEIC